MNEDKHETTTNASHTPGPWEATFDEAAKVEDSQGATIALVTNLHLRGRRDGNEVEANAHLIAAAPEMLEALMLIAEVLPSGREAWEANSQEVLARDIALQAITKATGMELAA